TAMVWLAVLLVFVKNAALFFLGVYVGGDIVSYLFARCPEEFWSGFRLAYYLVPGVGFAVVFDLFMSRQRLNYLLVPLALAIPLIGIFQVHVATLLSVSALCGLLIGMW